MLFKELNHGDKFKYDGQEYMKIKNFSLGLGEMNSIRLTENNYPICMNCCYFDDETRVKMSELQFCKLKVGDTFIYNGRFYIKKIEADIGNVFNIECGYTDSINHDTLVEKVKVKCNVL